MPELLGQESGIHLVPVGYDAAEEALEALLMRPPRVLVMTGYSARASGLRLELGAHDHRSTDLADAFGFVPRPSDTLPNWLWQDKTDLAAVADRLSEAGAPCQTSRDGGAFVCNHLYYQALRRIAAGKLDTRAVFIHLPAISGTKLAQEAAGAMDLPIIARTVANIARMLAER